jgi:hypothetical protein
MQRYITEVQKAYVAGILDGEGSITNSPRKHRRKVPFCIVVSITNQSYALLEYIQSIIGGKIYRHSIQKQNGKQNWRLVIHRQLDVVYLLENIKDYLCLKKARAEKALEDYHLWHLA